MNRDQKAAVIDEVASQIQESQAVFAVDYRGISVPQAAQLRTKLNDAGARFRVVKNTLTDLAVDRAGADPLKEVLDGPTAFTFVATDGGDVALAAKALAQFRRETNLLEFKGGVMDGQALSAEQIGEIARLPAKDVLYGQVVGMIASPITGLVRGLNALITGLAIQLKQIADQGLVEGGPGEPAAEAEPATAEEEPAAEGGSAAEAEAAPGSEAPSGSEAAAESSEAPEDAPAEAEQAAQADQAEEEAAQSAEGQETESSSEESAPAGEEAAGDETAGDETAGNETNESDTPSEGDGKD
jgi:large subunit ribosomal protein L10